VTIAENPAKLLLKQNRYADIEQEPGSFLEVLILTVDDIKLKSEMINPVRFKSIMVSMG
jgi:hypothetical protein